MKLRYRKLTNIALTLRHSFQCGILKCILNQKKHLDITSIQSNSFVIAQIVHTPLLNSSSGYWKRTTDILQSLAKIGSSSYILAKNNFIFKLHSNSILININNKTDYPNNKYKYKFGVIKSYLYAGFIRKFCKMKNVSIIHAHSNFENGIPAIMAGLMTGLPVIYEVRGFWYLTGLSTDKNQFKSLNFKHAKKLELLCCKHADMIVTLSESMKNYIVSEGIEASKVHVIPNAVDQHRFKPLPINIGLRKQWPIGGFVVGFIGSITPYEGLSDLVTAIKILREKKIEISLVIAGSGPYESQLLKLIKGKDYVYYAGHIPHQEVELWYAGFDCCAYPRRNDPVCQYVPPLKVLEAMAMAKPIIVSNLPPLIEMIQPNLTGLVCKPDNPNSLADQLEFLSINKAIANKLGVSARAWVEKHRTWEVNAHKYIDVYRGNAAI